jgi:hypothetical protein
MSGSTYQVTPMHPTFVGEHLPGNAIWSGSPVKYLDTNEREAFKLSFRFGRIIDAEGKVFDTTSSRTLLSNFRRAIFVMDQDGNFFASKFHSVGRFHHSSFLAGAPVAAAGEIEVRKGELVTISDRSGHYLPGRRFTMQALDALQKCGVAIAKVKQDLIAGSDTIK